MAHLDREGNDPMWSPSGRELFYRNGREMMVVDVETEPEFRAGAPRLLFEGSQRTGNRCDVTPDGQRFVMIQPELASGTAQLNFVLNRHEELKRLVPTD